jgi:hypothetical protein
MLLCGEVVSKLVFSRAAVARELLKTSNVIRLLCMYEVLIFGNNPVGVA